MLIICVSTLCVCIYVCGPLLCPDHCSLYIHTFVHTLPAVLLQWAALVHVVSVGQADYYCVGTEMCAHDHTSAALCVMGHMSLYT